MVRASRQIAPNVVLPVVAIVLDLHIPPTRVGLFMSVLMSHTFAAHALEASDHDAEVLRVLPAEALDYRGPAPRQSAAAAAATASVAGRG